MSEDKNTKPWLQHLEELCDGLVYISETDAPVIPLETLRVEKLTKKSFLESVGREPKSVKEVDANVFLDRLAEKKPWHSKLESDRASRFRKLKELLVQHLDEIRVFKIGSIRIDIYIVGRDADGRIVGVKTRAVET